ncbi:transcriptional regulator, AraC family domain protein [Burkholderia mallei]|nr:transcriptional regulator, AraC family domain protein [Burkholderia mallei]
MKNTTRLPTHARHNARSGSGGRRMGTIRRGGPPLAKAASGGAPCRQPPPARRASLPYGRGRGAMRGPAARGAAQSAVDTLASCCCLAAAGCAALARTPDATSSPGLYGCLRCSVCEGASLNCRLYALSSVERFGTPQRLPESSTRWPNRASSPCSSRWMRFIRS